MAEEKRTVGLLENLSHSSPRTQGRCLARKGQAGGVGSALDDL